MESCVSGEEEMKKKVFGGLILLLSISFSATSLLQAADMDIQHQQRVFRARTALQVIKTSVSSCTPGKAVLTQGGAPVLVALKGSYLTAVHSARAVLPGNPDPGIAATLDKTQLPAVLKISLQASKSAPVASNYQLAIYDSGNHKLLDLPTHMLAIQVKAPQLLQKFAESALHRPQTRPLTSILKARLTSVTPQKAVLYRGKSAVSLRATGINLAAVASVQVTRGGSVAAGIGEDLDKSGLPARLGISIRASSRARIADNYQLSLFDSAGRNVMTVPASILAIEVKALQALAATPSRTRQHRFAGLKKPALAVGIMEPDLGIGSLNAPVPLKEGKIQAIEMTWKNFGRIATENKSYLVVIWYRSAGDDSWKLFDSKSFSNPVNPGQKTAFTFSRDADHSLPGGTHSFRGEVDVNKALTDLNRGNNKADKTFSIQHLPITINALDPPYAHPGQWTHLKVHTDKNMTLAHSRHALGFIINGQPAAIKYVNDLNYQNWDICAVVPQNATSGPVALVCDGVKHNAPQDLHVVAPVTVSGFTPKKGSAGDIITIQGTNFVPYRLPEDQISTGVSITNGMGQTGHAIKAEHFVSSREIRFKIPCDARTGILTINTLVEGKKTEARTSIALQVLPKINYFVPYGFNEGREVRIVGCNLATATSVAFNGTPAPVGEVHLNANSVTLIARVPIGATTGKVSVTNKDGMTGFSDRDFRVIHYAIHSLSPASGPEGTLVTLTGQDFDWQGTKAYIDWRDGNTSSRINLPFVGTPTRTSAQVQIPSGLNRPGPAYIYVNYAGESNWAEFTITAP